MFCRQQCLTVRCSVEVRGPVPRGAALCRSLWGTQNCIVGTPKPLKKCTARELQILRRYIFQSCAALILPPKYLKTGAYGVEELGSSVSRTSAGYAKSCAGHVPVMESCAPVARRSGPLRQAFADANKPAPLPPTSGPRLLSALRFMCPPDVSGNVPTLFLMSSGHSASRGRTRPHHQRRSSPSAPDPPTPPPPHTTAQRAAACAANAKGTSKAARTTSARDVSAKALKPVVCPVAI